MLLLSGSIGKVYKVRTYFVKPIDEIPAIFSNIRPVKLAHAYFVFPL